jgi:hypothetical protein
MKSITSRFVMLIATAAVAPLVTYGLVSVLQLRNGTEESVFKGNLGIAQQVATQINQYVENNQRVLRSISLELRTTGLARWQQSRILKDAVLDFPEFRELSMFDAGGHPIETSRFGAPTVAVPPASSVGDAPFYVAEAGQRPASHHDHRGPHPAWRSGVGLDRRRAGAGRVVAAG